MVNPSQLQLGHGIFSVETCSPPVGCSRLYELQLGHGIFSVETVFHGVVLSPLGFASIGPRNFLRGNGLTLINTHGQPIRFNWATEFSPWKLLNAELSGLGTQSFNWATEFSPWKRLISGAAYDPVNQLQLGHGIFSVETVCGGICDCYRGLASIGPRNFLRGNSTLSGGAGRPCGGFNWATEFSPWKLHNCIFCCSDKLRASIGPRNFLRGNSPHGM